MLGFHKLDRHKVSKTGDCRKLLGQPYGRNASSMTRIWGSMFTLMGCSLAGLKMSLRTGFCCRNFLAPAAPYLDSKYVTKNFAPIALWQDIDTLHCQHGPQSPRHSKNLPSHWQPPQQTAKQIQLDDPAAGWTDMHNLWPPWRPHLKLASDVPELL